MIQRLSSDFIFDSTHLFHENGISLEMLYEAEKMIQIAGKKMNLIREIGEFSGHLSKDGEPEKVLFTRLPFPSISGPNVPSQLERLIEFGEQARDRIDSVISFGIGGSYLGNQVLFDLHCGEFWNVKNTEDRSGWPRMYFSGNSLDPKSSTGIAEEIIRQSKVAQSHHKPYRALLVVISKSGSTVDTMASFFIVKEILEKAEVNFEIWAVTDPAEGDQSTWLGKLADQEKWPRFSIPDGIGGRFSVLSEVGLVTAVLSGFDIKAFLQGAASMDKECRSEHWQSNPALLNGTVKWLLATKRDLWIEVFMPYGRCLKSLSEWYVQLLAESLGKRSNWAGQEVNYGRTPVVAVGTTDMHAQTQAHQDGRRDKLIQFLTIKKWKNDPTIPNLYPNFPVFSEWSGKTLGEALEIARQSNDEALWQDGRLSALISLPELSPYLIGQLFYFLMLSVVYEGILAGVDPFDQPGVEAYKKIMSVKLKK